MFHNNNRKLSEKNKEVTDMPAIHLVAGERSRYTTNKPLIPLTKKSKPDNTQMFGN